MTKEDVDFEVQAALAWHDDDVNATIATLLEGTSAICVSSLS